MDGHRFDGLARALASGMSRRRALRTLVSSAGAGVAGSIGVSRVAGQDNEQFKLAKTPKIEREGTGVKLVLELPSPSGCIVEYGDTKEFGEEVESKKVTVKHEVVIPDLVPDTPYYFRVVVMSAVGPVTTKTYKFTAPSASECPPSTVLCNGSCVPDCGVNGTLDPATCTCICAPGFGTCSSGPTGPSPSDICATPLNTVDDCLECGKSCDDGNACTDNLCDPVAGCVSTNVANGTACGSNGICVDGACVDCVPGGTCAADADCCDDELCLNGACVAKSAILEDVNNCGAVGNVCPDSPCQTAICVDGVCQSQPKADGESCDDGNPCTADGQCVAGVCVGTPVEDGQACLDTGTCTNGVCADCESGGTCSSDAECCAGELCCDGTCVGKDALQNDVENCGACGNVCEESDNPCERVICKQGECVIEDVADGEICGADNPCMSNAVCKDGLCQGDPVENGTPCGTDGVCEGGQCTDLESFETAAFKTLFADNFETGAFKSWSAVDGAVVQNAIVGSGKYAARATGVGNVAYARRVLSSTQKELFIKTRFQIVSQGANSVYLLRSFRTSSSPLISVFVSSSGRLSTFNNVTGQTTTSATTIAKGVWYELDLRVRVNGSSSLATVWLNRVKVGDISRTVSLGSGGTRIVQIGDNVVRRTFDVVFDDFSVCAGGLCPALESPPPPGTSRAPGAAESVLLARYTHNSNGGVDWASVVYRPRQMKTGLVINDPTRGSLRVDNAGSYEGWDVLPTYNWSVHRIQSRSDWTVVHVNRASTMALVWRGGTSIPSWLGSWSKSESVTIAGKSYPTYRKSFSAGKISLGGVMNPTDSPGNGRDTYWILLAESDALPSPAPTVPGGRQIPAPNATCPAWVHDQYVATGPDGKSYPTWHHLIDPVYWCYHRHEHGTNPEWFGGGKKPVFSYSASKHGMTEVHAGFKNHVFDSADGTRWMFTQHFGTAGLGRACIAFHTLDVAVKNIATGELLADLHFMGDFGKAVVNSTNVPLTPPTCPDQAKLASGSTGVRMIPSQADGGIGYEPWRVDLSKTIFGFVGDITINNPDGMVICNSSRCDQGVSTGESGSKRFFTVNRDVWGNMFGLVAGSRTGEFYTDVMGHKVVSSSDPGAVRQYIKPGMKATVQVAGHCYDVHAWGSKLDCSAVDGAPTNREGSILAPN